MMKSGKPMHYDSITNIAIELGLLKTNNQSPAIAMSSALSREITNNEVSIFKRIRRGVFELIPSAIFGYEISNYKKLDKRISALKNKINLHSTVAVIRRALFIFRIAMEIIDNDCMLTVNNGIDSVKICLKSACDMKDSICSLNIQPEAKTRNGKDSFFLSYDLCAAANDICTRFGVDSTHEVLDMSVLLLEVAAYIQNQGNVILIGTKDSKFVQIKSSREE